MAVLGLRFCARAFSSCGKWWPLFIAVRGPLTIAASPVAERRLQTRRLSSCGSRASLLRGMWDLPRPGLEPVCPALAGRLSTTAPPGKPSNAFFYLNYYYQTGARNWLSPLLFNLFLCGSATWELYNIWSDAWLIKCVLLKCLPGIYSDVFLLFLPMTNRMHLWCNGSIRISACKYATEWYMFWTKWSSM